MNKSMDRRSVGKSSVFWIILTGAFCLLQMACGGTSAQKGSPPPPTPCGSNTFCVQVQHVFVVVLENHGYSDVMGNTQEMPYLNSLANNYAYAQNYYANSHPSIGNYFMMTAGQIITQDDGFSGTVSSDNVVRHLLRAGKTWKEYSENLPSIGYIGGDASGFTEHHNPFTYFSDVRGNSAQEQNLVSFAQLNVDMNNHSLPDYGFIVPSDADNGTSSLAQADAWVQKNIGPLIQSPDLSKKGSGVVIITFDEASHSDTAMGGGHVAWIAVGPDIKKGYVGTQTYQHQSMLRFMTELIGLRDFPGSAATSPDMREFLAGD